MKNFAGEGLKGALQFIFIMVTILATLVMCSYNAHSFEKTHKIDAPALMTDGQTDDLKCLFFEVATELDFYKSHRHLGVDEIKKTVTVQNTFIVITYKCGCNVKEVSNETRSGDMQKMRKGGVLETNKS